VEDDNSFLKINMKMIFLFLKPTRDIYSFHLLAPSWVSSNSYPISATKEEGQDEEELTTPTLLAA
jgi:hypothetical protein